MDTPDRDPLAECLFGPNGLRRAVEVVWEAKCYGAAPVLLFALIEAMANLVRPEGKVEADKHDFMDWVERYLKIPGDHITKPKDWYGMRCATLHTYGNVSSMSRNRDARMICWAFNRSSGVAVWPYVRYNAEKTPDLIVVDLVAFKNAVFDGLDRFATEGLADPKVRELAQERADGMVMTIPIDERNATSAYLEKAPSR